MNPLVALALLFSCNNTPVEAETVTPITPPPRGEGFQLTMETTVEPYSEVWDCAVYPMPVDEIQNVNWVEFQQNEGMHHMTLSTALTPEGVGLAEGLYDCDEVYTGDFMQNQTMFFGNQGDGQGTLHLPDGVAATLPATIDIVHEVHFVNSSDQAIDIYSRVNAWTIPESEVTSGIWGGSVRDENINIPPETEAHTEWSRCVMNRDVDVLFLASHTHARGVEFTIAPFDGTETGEIFYSNDDWHDPKIVQYDPPLVVPQGTGFEFACTWKNEDDFPVEYGLTAEDEMCNMAIVHTPFDITAWCDVVETSDGVLWSPDD